MKNQITKTLTVVALVMGMASTSQAGPSGFDSEHFNQMINESLKVQSELRQDLREQAGFRKAEQRRILAVKEIADSGNRVVNVTSEPTIKLQKSKTQKDRLKLERRNFDRISAELNEAL